MKISDGWLKTHLNHFLDRGGGVNSSGCNGMIVGKEENICLSNFGGRVGMERPNSDIDENISGLKGSRRESIFAL